MCKIYMIYFPNGKKYLGVTSTDKRARFAAHKHADYAVGRAIRKYGITHDCMKILFEGTEEECYELEELIVDEGWVADTSTYNMCVGGIKPCGVSLKGSDNPMWKGGVSNSPCTVCKTPCRGVMCFPCRKLARCKIKGDARLCSCGCGKPTSRPEYEYRRGHRPK